MGSSTQRGLCIIWRDLFGIFQKGIHSAPSTCITLVSKPDPTFSPPDGNAVRPFSGSSFACISFDVWGQIQGNKPHQSHIVDPGWLCRKKVPSEEPVFRLAGMELLKIDTPVYHISRYLPAVRQSTAPFSFVMCLTLPYARRILALVLIFEADGMLGAAPHSDDDDDDDEDGTGKLSPFDLCMARSAPRPPALIRLISCRARSAWTLSALVTDTYM